MEVPCIFMGWGFALHSGLIEKKNSALNMLMLFFYNMLNLASK